MKDLLMRQINKLEDGELLEIHMRNNSRFYICKPNMPIPLAIRLIYKEPEMTSNYFVNSEGESAQRVDEYINSHTVTIGNNDYIIEEEITACVYYDDYIYLNRLGIGAQYEAYLKYDEICFFTKNRIEHYHSEGSQLAIEYNKLMLELNLESKI